MSSSGSRPRTRRQWDGFYKDYHTKRKQQSQTNEANDFVVDHSNINVLKSDGGHSSCSSTRKKHDFVVHMSESGQGESSRDHDNSSNNNVASDLRGKRKSDVESMNDGNAATEFFPEDVVSSPVSGPNVDDSDDDRGSFQYMDISDNSTADSDGESDESLDSESTSLSDADTSDSEYREENELLSSSESDRSTYYLSGKNDAYDSDGYGGSTMNGEEEKKMRKKIYEEIKHDTERKNGKRKVVAEVETDDGGSDGDDGGNIRTETSVSRREQECNVVNIDDKEKSPFLGSPRFCRKKESVTAQATDSQTDESCREDRGRGTSYSTSLNKEEDVVFIANDFPSVGKNPRANVRIDDDSIKSSLKKNKLSGSENMVEFDSSNGIEQRISKEHLRQCPISTSQKKDSGPTLSSLFHNTDSVLPKRGKHTLDEEAKRSKKSSPAERMIDLIKILVDSLNAEVPPSEENAVNEESLPLKFRFEDEVQPPPEKSEWEKDIDSLFLDMELALAESELNCSVAKIDVTVSKDTDNSPEACCGRGEHHPILDEQIGYKCRYCSAVILEIQYVLPPFYTPPLRRNNRKEFDESPRSVFSDIQFQDSACGPLDPFIRAKGTVWDLVPGVEKGMFPHQREGFEFMWQNIAGDINIDKLKGPLSDDGRGCIISHAPGTGKSRMTIVFLMSFLKLYPTCRPVIIAPRGMLLTWEDEFKKWKADVAFHNVNNNELSRDEIQIAAKSTGHIGPVGLSNGCIRLVKLYSWLSSKSVLGISYRLFDSLVGGDGKKGSDMQSIWQGILKKAGLLVLDEGHTPRNSETRQWKTLMNVSTQRRIILSGTPFQNNFDELYNTLCLVNPKFFHQIQSQSHERGYECRGRRSKVIKRKWMDLTSSIDKDGDGLKKIRTMLDPFVHLHKGTILQKSLPGLRDTVVFLHPTELQKTLLKVADEECKDVLRRTHLVSLISVHPWMVNGSGIFSPHKNKLEKIESHVDEGVKIKFVMTLISLADRIGERVLIFSQFVDPLKYIQRMLKFHFKWSEGQEILYMDGQLNERQRQKSISSLNNCSSAAKVLLASEKACSEGINLVGASRVVLLDTVWNPSVERQAISRAYRLGQKRVVYVYRLITSGSEVRQYQLQSKKDRISQLIFSPADGKSCGNDATDAVVEDKILDTMRNDEHLRHIFEKTIHQPKESDLIETFGFVDV